MEAGFEAVIATAPEQRLTCDEGDVTEAIEEEEDVHDVLLTMSHVTGASLGGDCESVDVGDARTLETLGIVVDTDHRLHLALTTARHQLTSHPHTAIIVKCHTDSLNV